MLEGGGTERETGVCVETGMESGQRQATRLEVLDGGWEEKAVPRSVQVRENNSSGSAGCSAVCKRGSHG